MVGFLNDYGDQSIHCRFRYLETKIAITVYRRRRFIVGTRKLWKVGHCNSNSVECLTGTHDSCVVVRRCVQQITYEMPLITQNDKYST